MASQNDYTTWQHAELIERVQKLEQKLRETTQELSDLTTATEKDGQQPLLRGYDASKHSSRKIALKFAYIGANYNGLEHHNNNTTSLPPVEKVLWQALMKTRLIAPEFKAGQKEDEVSWEGCDYGKCGRTDKGVSSFGQVISLRMRSARPLPKQEAVDDEDEDYSEAEEHEAKPFDPIRDELPYIHLLNKVLPPDIRVLAWCGDLPADFDARFSCRERRYRYFFTNPAFLPIPGLENQRERWLDLEAMSTAAKKYEGLHDFRNFCKIDGAKQLTTFDRRIFRAEIHAVDDESVHNSTTPRLYYFEVRGSAFLWHQVRHLVAVLFLVGQGLEQPEIVDHLLDVERMPARPAYQLASDAPLVLWDCIFPDVSTGRAADHVHNDSSSIIGYEDAIPWQYENQSSIGRIKAPVSYTGDRLYDRDGVMENLWTQWRGCKLKEVLAQQLMAKVAGECQLREQSELVPQATGKDRTFEGGDVLRPVGKYVPMVQRKTFAETPDVVNARYLARKARLTTGSPSLK